MSVTRSAVVLGLNSHGLAVARSLARNGIRVYAITPFMRSPANRTRYAEVFIRPGIATKTLTNELLEFADRFPPAEKPVLFPTSDHMVRQIGGNWHLLDRHYVLSWAGAADVVLDLMRKDKVADRCLELSIRHPASRVVSDLGEAQAAMAELSPPFIVKPVNPQAGFKAEIFDDDATLGRLVDRHHDDLPFVIQQYVPGSTSSLYFCTSYWNSGREIAWFTGRKLRSLPPGTGQGTVITSELNEEVLHLSRQFLSGLRFSGPVSLEFKRDSDDRYWLIEPNVGRTEFCVDLAIQAGRNFPLIEYLDQTGENYDELAREAQRDVTWYDTVNDPLCFAKYSLSNLGSKYVHRHSVFPYLGHDDKRPLIRATYRLIGRVSSKLVGRLRLGRPQTS